MRLYVCRGSGEVGGAPRDYVGWCRWCKRIQRTRVGSGVLHQHFTSTKAHARTP